jgi:PAS domain S-box-containing protein
MFDFKEYDKGFSGYASKSNFRTMPLSSWDFYSSHLAAITQELHDTNVLKQLSTTQNWKLNFDLEDVVNAKNVVVVTDPKLSIVFTTANMFALNGYRPEEVIGKSPKMFQGKDTCPKTSLAIREAVLSQKPFDEVVLNYCKNGSIYKCRIKGYPVFDKKGVLKNFIALEKAA